MKRSPSPPAADLGRRIRKLRLRQARTLEEIADACDFTCSLLSKIETGKTVPPLATLDRIANSLGTTVSHLLGDSDEHATQYTPAADATGNLTATSKGYSFHAFAARRADKLMQPFLFVAKRGEIKRQRLTHRGEEFVYVLAGKMRYRVGEVEYQLGPGDSLYFDSEQPHDLEAVTAEVRFLAVFVEPPTAKGKE